MIKSLTTDPGEKSLFVKNSNLILPSISTSLIWSPKKKPQKLTKNPKTNLNKTVSLSQTKPLKKIRINKKLEFLHKLNLEIGIDEIYADQINQEKQKEKLNNNIEVKQKRLGLYKKEEEENKKTNYQNIEISLENDLYMKKVDTKEKEKITEKKFKQALQELKKIEEEIYELNLSIKELMDNIENKKIEINVLTEGYNLEKEKNTNNTDISENEKFEQYSKIVALKIQKEEKEKIINGKIEKLKGGLLILEHRRNKLRLNCKKIKKNIYELRKELVNMYHLKLYEGLDFHNDGLSTIIRNIWNLGVNVDINFMPTYLDQFCIDYLLAKTKKLIEISKMRQFVDDAQNDLVKSIKTWKKELGGAKNNSVDKIKNNFFETRINNSNLIEYDNSFLAGYPKSKKFMLDYMNKHKQEFEINEKYSVTKSKFIYDDIPLIITEKQKKIEKIKFLLLKLQDQIEQNEIKEIKRLSKEFSNNNYQEKYGVSEEVIIAALCGEEHKDERLNIFSRFQKDYKDDIKKIEFHSNFLRPVKK